MKSFRIAALAGAIASLIAGSALACTTVVVGQEATSDGSILIARSADSSALKAQHLVIHPAKKGQKGMYRTADHHGANNFEYPLPEMPCASPRCRIGRPKCTVQRAGMKRASDFRERNQSLRAMML